MPNITACPDPLRDVDAGDILAAMKEANGYLDITPADALELYRAAYAHAEARIRDSLAVGRIMTRQVVSAPEDLPAVQVARLLALAGVSGLPVLRGDGLTMELAGVISIKDFLIRLSLPRQATAMTLVAELLSGALGPAPDLSQAVAREIMSAPAVSISPEVSSGQAAALMLEHGINRLPVLQDGKIVGMVTRGDLVRACHLSLQENGA